MSLSKNVSLVCNRYPYISQGLFSGVLQVFSDVIAQKFIEKKEKIDFKRCCNFLIVGYFTGLLLRKWYGFLDVAIRNPKRLRNAVSKVVADQMIFAPTFLGLSTGFVGFLQTGEIQGIKEILKREYPDIMTSNYKFWPAAQFTNFYFVPLNYQVGLNSILAVAWSTYFSYKTYSSFQEEVLKAKKIDLSEFDSHSIEERKDI